MNERKERIEAWRAREKLRTDLGCASVFIGTGGVLAILVGIEAARGADGRPPPLPWPLVLVLGVGLLVCAVGLWNVRPWARWTGVAFFALLFGAAVVELVRERELSWALFVPPFLMVYLLLPSTSRRFGRAQILRQPRG